MYLDELLVRRHKTEGALEVFKLKYTSTDELPTQRQLAVGPSTEEQDTYTEISLKEILEDGEEWTDFRMAALPTHSQLYIKEFKNGHPSVYHKALLQVESKTKVKVINLRSETMKDEVLTTEKSDLFKDPELYVETPVETSEISHPYEWNSMSGFVIASNFGNSMRALSGCIFSSFSAMDIWQLKRTFDEPKESTELISDIDLLTATRQFPERQNLFSMFLLDHTVFEKLLD